MATLQASAPCVKPAPAGTCRLTLTIRGADYSVRGLVPDPLAGVGRAYRLRKLADGSLYDVAETEHGPVCDCPDFAFRRDGLDPQGCKHVRALVALGLLA
jgi:hypothetical protein